MIASGSHRELRVRLTPPVRVGDSGLRQRPAGLPAGARSPGAARPGGVRPGLRAAAGAARGARRAPARPAARGRRRRRCSAAQRRRRRADAAGAATRSTCAPRWRPAATSSSRSRWRLTRADAEAARPRSPRTRGLHLLAAPFVQLSPTFRELWTLVADGALGHVALGPRPVRQRGLDLGGLVPRRRRRAAGRGRHLQPQEPRAAARPGRRGAGRGGHGRAAPRGRRRRGRRRARTSSTRCCATPGGALSSVVASQAVQRYRRPGLELYGTEGSANLLGDDWDPRGLEVWRNDARHLGVARARWTPRGCGRTGCASSSWRCAEGRPPLTALDLDLHLLDVLDAARTSAATGSDGPGRVDASRRSTCASTSAPSATTCTTTRARRTSSSAAA